MIRGDRRESAERRTADNRPQPYVEEHGAFESDRLAIGEAITRQQEAHRREHVVEANHMEGFSHPACQGLSPKLRRTCPFTARRWTVVRKLERGVELKAKGKFEGELGESLRRQLLCHIAFGRAGQEGGGCPLHLKGVRASTRIEKDGFLLQLETSEPELVAELQRRVQDLN